MQHLYILTMIEFRKIPQRLFQRGVQLFCLPDIRFPPETFYAEDPGLSLRYSFYAADESVTEEDRSNHTSVLPRAYRFPMNTDNPKGKRPMPCPIVTGQEGR